MGNNNLKRKLKGGVSMMHLGKRRKAEEHIWFYGMVRPHDIKHI